MTNGADPCLASELFAHDVVFCCAACLDCIQHCRNHGKVRGVNQDRVYQFVVDQMAAELMVYSLTKLESSETCTNACLRQKNMCAKNEYTVPLHMLA